ncbi:MAG: sigma-70 family RNA polymerase sigma factor [Methylococcales bacterium]|nr:sigma-70 family RNA polymerase sigma factor [Methylococcales bacterium]MDP3839216.1 sigma-70 family RNA polymerase sigma factor [Methylococcales bacterium]
MPKLTGDFLQDVFLKYAHELGGFVRARWPKEQDVADIIQESFLRLSQTPSPERIENPRAFLFQTAANMVVDRHRRRQVRENYLETHVDSDAAPYQHSPENHWEHQEALEQLNVWLNEMPALQRHAFVLYRIEGYSHAEIAKHLDISVRCSERYIKRVMEHISTHLDDIGGF